MIKYTITMQDRYKTLFASIILQGLRGHSVGLVNWSARE